MTTIRLTFLDIRDDPKDANGETPQDRFSQAEGALATIFGFSSPEFAGSAPFLWQLNETSRLGIELVDPGKNVRLTFRALAGSGQDRPNVRKVIDLLNSVGVPTTLEKPDEQGHERVRLQCDGPRLKLAP